jgi:pyruvate-formate lyase-activating enzyme
MTTATLPVLSSERAFVARPGVTWRPSPYLHIADDRLYNPHTDQTLVEGTPGYARLRLLVDRKAHDLTLDDDLEPLAAAGWLVDSETDLSRRFHLKYVSLEAHTVCNQACYFCPVSVAPRESHFMPMETYRRILGEIADLGEPIEAVFMISYNEPTADPRFIEQVQAIKEAGLKPATLTNGTGLTPKRVDQLVELGGLRFLSINISTLDRDRYQQDRGHDHLQQVLRNLDYAKDRAVSQDMDIVVLGTGNQTHQDDFEAIRERFAGSRFNVKHFVANDRAGLLQVGMRAKDPEKTLCGCDYMGSRPLQHLHITPRAKCILCCQDYHETWEVGDLETQSVREVLEGPAFARARRWVYGQEAAPDNFLCNGCRYALRR